MSDAVGARGTAGARGVPGAQGVSGAQGFSGAHGAQPTPGSGGAVGGVTGVTLGSTPVVHPDTALQEVGGRWMAATADDKLHTFEDDDGSVSEVGERIVALVDGRRTVSDIVDALLEEFEVSRETCEADTLAFVEMLVGRQVLSLR